MDKEKNQYIHKVNNIRATFQPAGTNYRFIYNIMGCKATNVYADIRIFTSKLINQPHHGSEQIKESCCLSF